MKLYHFCREKDFRGIRAQGITKGVIPTVQRMEKHTKRKYSPVLIRGWQWLTLNGNHEQQSWATRELFKDDRTEFRFTLEIPEAELGSLYDKEKLLSVYPEIGPLFDGWKGSEDWRVFRGTIPKYWIKAIEQWKDGEWKSLPWR